MDYSLPIRRAILPAMKAAVGITALVPAGNIYPSVVPLGRTLPFTRYGAPIASPFRASGLDSSSVRVTLHAFTGPRVVGGQVVETAEDLCQRMAAAIATAMDGRVMPIEGGMTVTLSWLGSNCIVDRDESDAWHAIVNLVAEVAG